MTRSRNASSLDAAARRVLATAMVVAMVPSPAFVAALAQEPPATGLRFEAASVKPNKKTFAEHFRVADGGGGGAFSGVRTLPGGRLEASWASVRPMIMRAFDVRFYQLEGGPGWLDDDKFDIVATAGREATLAELNAMLRTLLEERFRLRVREVTEDAPVYALVTARSDGRLGPGLRPSSSECVAEMARRQSGGVRPPPPPPPREPDAAPICGSNFVGSGLLGGRRLAFGGTTLAAIANMLGPEFDGPLEDRTGLSGPFDVVLEFRSTAMERAGRAPVGGDTSTAPGLNEALQDQLGLRVEKTTGPVRKITIESIERPSPD